MSSGMGVLYAGRGHLAWLAEQANNVGRTPAALRAAINHSTQGLKCSFFGLWVIFVLIRDDNILPKKELHWSLWVD